jgi:hypothetical protein
MIVKMSAIAAGAFVLTLVFGCASQPSGSPSSGGAQASSASSGASSGQKCEIDVKRVCQEGRDKPVIDSQTGQMQDSTEREQNASGTDTRIFPLQIPNGSMVEVQCEINTRHKSVVYAHLMPSPPLTPTDVAYLQNIGYCAH